MGRVLVGSSSIIILPPLAQVKRIMCFRYGVCARIQHMARKFAVQRTSQFGIEERQRMRPVDPDTGYDRLLRAITGYVQL